MRKLFIILPALMMSLALMAEPKPLRVLVLGDDPMMVTDELTGAVGYANQLQPLFDDAVTVDVQASPTLLPTDPASLLSAAHKGDVALVCKRPVEEKDEDKTMADIYLNQLLAIQQAAQKKGVKLIWLTPACPRYFTADTTQVHRMGIYPEVVRRMCQRDALPIIDVENLTFDWLTEAGMDSTAKAFVPVQPSIPAAENKTAREGNILNETGAQQVAALIANAIRSDKKNILNKRLRQ
ncbi:MAG: hypothetical protein IJT12_08775 [Paludibacteraceae bacterium]|nr:hypothetical protein [Paludibacteraceae bacterium]